MQVYFKFLIALLLVVSCNNKQENINEDPEQLRSSLEPTRVKINKAQMKTFESLIYATGKIQAKREVQIKFEKSGRLDIVSIYNGKSIQKGDLIAQLDDDKEQLALKKAEANLEQKKFEFESELMSYSFSELPENKKKTIRNNVRHSSGLVTAELEYEQAKLQLDYTRVVSPINGVVVNSLFSEGNYINPSDILCTVYTPNELEVSTKVLEGDLAKLSLGVKATISPIDNNSSSNAKVTEINPKVNEKGFVDIKLEVTEKRPGLIPGMNVEVNIQVPNSQNIVIPKESIVIRSGREVVFVAEGKRAKWRYVTTGLDNGKEVEIIEGLDLGDSVIINNNLQLAHDASIETGNSQ